MILQCVHDDFYQSHFQHSIMCRLRWTGGVYWMLTGLCVVSGVYYSTSHLNGHDDGYREFASREDGELIFGCTYKMAVLQRPDCFHTFSIWRRMH
jgi:hypothetical protein